MTRVGPERRRQRGDPDVANTVDMARALAALFGAGGTLTLLSLAFPHWPGLNPAGLAAPAVAAEVTCVFLLVLADRLPYPSFHVLLAFGTGCICVAAHFGGSAGHTIYAAYYVWVALYGFYFFSWKGACGHLVLAGAGYVAVLSATPSAAAGPSWLVMMGTAAVSGVVVAALVRELRALARREREAGERLRDADAHKDAFLSTVSHELRTPLTSIVGFSDLLGVDATEEQRSFLERISRNADEMSRMVERLLDFTRLSSGRVAVEPVPLLLRPQIDRSLTSLAGVLEPLDVVVDVPPDLTVLADADALDRIMANLVTNAAKFSPPGGRVTISAATTAAAAADAAVGGAVVGAGTVTVSVRDEGPGVPEELRSRIFERFFQAPDQPPGRRGTGVGLSIVLEYVERHGGRVWCSGERGEGATFSFTLSLVAAGPGAGGPAPDVPAASSGTT